MSSTKRIYSLDLMKVLAIWFVVILHSGVWKPNYQAGNFKYLIEYTGRSISEGVPIFLFVNGFLLLQKKDLNLKKHYKKTIKLSALMVIWAFLIYIMCHLINGDLGNIGFHQMLDDILRLNIKSPYIGPLWFLQDLIGIYLVFPVIKYLYDDHFEEFKFIFFLIAFFTVGISCLNVLNDVSVVATGFRGFDMLKNFINMLNPFGKGWFLFYFSLGGMTAHYQEKLLKKKKFIYICTVISIILVDLVSLFISKKSQSNYNQGLYYATFDFLLVLSLYLLMSSYVPGKNRLSSLVTSIGKYTFGIYFVHRIVICMMDQLLLGAALSLIARLGRSIIILVISYLIAWIISKIPKLKWFITT